MELCFSHLTMLAKFEHHLLNNLTVIIHAYDIIHRIVIFTLDAIFHIWSSSLDILLVRMRNLYGKIFICSTSNLGFKTNMHVHI